MHPNMPFALAFVLVACASPTLVSELSPSEESELCASIIAASVYTPSNTENCTHEGVVANETAEGCAADRDACLAEGLSWPAYNCDAPGYVDFALGDATCDATLEAFRLCLRAFIGQDKQLFLSVSCDTPTLGPKFGIAVLPECEELLEQCPNYR